MRNTRFITAILFYGLALGNAAFGQNGLPQPQQGAPQAAPAAAPLDAATYRQQIGYMLGQNVGNDLRENQIECDLESLIAGITDAFRGAPPKWSDAELQTCRQQFDQEMRQKSVNRMRQAAERNAKQAQAFLAKNGQQPGVQVTESGLQYKVLRQGNGATPKLNDTVRCHYRGTLIDGTEFDSSYSGKEPAEFPVNGVIAGWTEALQKMKVGDKWQLVVPAGLAYGSDPPPGSPIEPNSLLIFDVELLGIAGQQ